SAWRPPGADASPRIERGNEARESTRSGRDDRASTRVAERAQLLLHVVVRRAVDRPLGAPPYLGERLLEVPAKVREARRILRGEVPSLGRVVAQVVEAPLRGGREADGVARVGVDDLVPAETQRGRAGVEPVEREQPRAAVLRLLF